MIPQRQLSLADIFEDCKNFFESDKPQFLSLLENHIDLDEIIPVSFYNHYYAVTGGNRKYTLTAMLRALIIQRLFSIPTDSLLLVFLHYSRHLREFCGFSKVPDASKITRFKQNFLPDLQSVFDNLVDITEPICLDINGKLASMLLFDTSGIEAYVTENNPKYANHIIKQLKAYAKANNFNASYDPYKAVYSSMPSSAKANHEVKRQYINGHFCYAYKFGILTNGLGIVHSIDFYNKDYLDSHPDIPVEKKSKSPDEDKSIADSKALLPILSDFKLRHPDITPDIFLGDASFDTIEIYKSLFGNFNFKKAFIPLKAKLPMNNADYSFNENGISCCPHDSSLPMKREGSKSHLKSNLPKVMEYTRLLEKSGDYRVAEIIPLHVIRERKVYYTAVSAGNGSFLDGEDYEMYSSADIPEKADFGVHISGDSMEPVYHDRELIWIEQTEQLEDGEIGIFYLDGNAYVKQFQNNRKGAYLVSLNKAYEPMPITESSSFKIFGRVLS